MIHIPTPWLSPLRKEQFQQCYAHHKQCSVVAIWALCHLSIATWSDFHRTNELSSTRPNSIDNVLCTIANWKLCVLVLAYISLQANGFCLTSRPRVLSSLREVIQDLPDLGRSLTSLVNRCLLTIRLTVEMDNLPQWHTCFSHANDLPSYCIWKLWRTHSASRTKESRVTSLSNVSKMIRCKSSDYIALVPRHCTCNGWLL